MAEHSPNEGNCPSDDPDCLTTGDMARRSDTTLRTVRFYEEEGLIASMAREGGCHRKFAASELTKLQLIADLRAAGLSLHEIKALMSLKRGCGSPTAASQTMSRALCRRVEELSERIDTLTRVREELRSTVAALSHCEDCKEPHFPRTCSSCDVTKRQDSSRATELLWKE